MKCHRCGRFILANAASAVSVQNYGRTCARILGLLPEPDLLKPKRVITGERKRKSDSRQLRFPL